MYHIQELDLFLSDLRFNQNIAILCYCNIKNQFLPSCILSYTPWIEKQLRYKPLPKQYIHSLCYSNILQWH